MIRKILSTPQAAADLIEIGRHIAQDSPRAADKMLTAIDNKSRLLARSPELGRPRVELAPGLRSFPVAPYVIFYRITSRGIEIIRILHGSRDIVSEFK